MGRRALTGSGISGVVMLAVALTAGAGSSNATFPGDNGKILFEKVVDGDWEIMAMNPDGSAQVPLTDNEFEDRHPAVSANGRRIAFMRDKGAPDSEIFTMRIDGKRVRRVTKNDRNDDEPSFSPNGRWIAFVGSDGDNEIFKIRRNGEDEKQLTTNSVIDERPAWSPSGGLIAFDHEDGTFDLEIYTMKPGGGDKENISDFADHDFSPSWAPNGKRLCFTSNRSGSNSQVWKMRADGSNPAAVVESFSSRCAFAPNNNRIAYEVLSDIHTVKPSGNGIKDLDTAGGRHPDWQPR